MDAARGAQLSMDFIDLDHSYFTFTVPDGHNSARIQLDAACRLTDASGKADELFLFSSCKSEFMYRESGLFQDPNFDFCGVFSRDEYVIYRTFATHDPSRAMEAEAGRCAQRFGEVLIDLSHHSGARPLNSDREIFEATLANEPIVARTHFTDSASERTAVVEYPVKTMNVAKPTKRFQTDTGPLLVPRWVDPQAPTTPVGGGRAVEQFVLAFVSANRMTGGDLVLRVPTPVDTGGRLVWHYSRLLPVPTMRHEFFSATRG
jgi:hypothetical protein